MHPYNRASIASAFSNRALSLNGAFGLSKSSVENFLKHLQAILVRRLIDSQNVFNSSSRSSVAKIPMKPEMGTLLFRTAGPHKSPASLPSFASRIFKQSGTVSLYFGFSKNDLVS